MAGKIKKNATRLLLLILVVVICGGSLTAYAFSPAPPDVNPPGSTAAPSPDVTDDNGADDNGADDKGTEEEKGKETGEETEKETEKEEAEEKESEEEEETEKKEPEGGRDGEYDYTAGPTNWLEDYWWVLAIGAGVVVLVGVAARLLILRMRRKPVAAVVAEPRTIMPQAPAPLKYPVLIGNAHHIGARDSQQDSFCISDVFNAELRRSKGVLGVVADGMGGMADGAEVSALVARTMLHYFNENAFSAHTELDLLNMLFAANDNVNRFMSGRSRGGSTVVAVILRGDVLSWVAVGDSRIYLIRNGAIMQINREHTHGVDLDEKAATGEMTWEEALGNPKRAALTSYLGIGKLEKVDRNIRPMQLLPGDRILLMSDGVFGVLSDGEILSAMAYPPQESAAKLQEMTLAKQNPHQDNLTALIFQYNGKVDQ
jgi:serine/threonine protein phosphatase PrpC